MISRLIPLGPGVWMAIEPLQWDVCPDSNSRGHPRTGSAPVQLLPDLLTDQARPPTPSKEGIPHKHSSQTSSKMTRQSGGPTCAQLLDLFGGLVKQGWDYWLCNLRGLPHLEHSRRGGSELCTCFSSIRPECSMLVNPAASVFGLSPLGISIASKKLEYDCSPTPKPGEAGNPA